LQLTTAARIPCPEGDKVQQPAEENAFDHVVPVWLEIQQWPQQSGPDQIGCNAVQNVEDDASDPQHSLPGTQLHKFNNDLPTAMSR